MSLYTPSKLNRHPAMESGLSLRMARLAHDAAPTVSALAPQPKWDAATIDLSNAQNEVVRPGLLDILKSTIENEMVIDVRSTGKYAASSL